MKHLRFIYAAAVACALLASQPVLAAEQSFDTYGSAVITAGQGAAQESSAEVPGGGSETVHFTDQEGRMQETARLQTQFRMSRLRLRKVKALLPPR